MQVFAYYLIAVLVSFGVTSAFAEDTIVVVNTVSAEKNSLIKTFATLEAYPQILPEFVKSAKILNDDRNVAKMTLDIEGVKYDAEIKYQSPSPNQINIEVLSGELQGTTLTGLFTERQDRTQVRIDLDLQIAWYASWITMFVADENIESAVKTGLDKFSDFANNPQPIKPSIEEEETCFLFWCW